MVDLTHIINFLIFSVFLFVFSVLIYLARRRLHVILDGWIHCEMVTDNGHWSYCIVILRRKGRKRWCRSDAGSRASGASSSSNGPAAILASAAPRHGHEAAAAGTMRSRCEKSEKSFSRGRESGFYVGASWSWGQPAVGCDRPRPYRAGGRFAPLCDFWCRVAAKLHLPSVECLRWLLIVFLYLNFLSSNAVSAAVDVGSYLRELRPTSNANSSSRESEFRQLSSLLYWVRAGWNITGVMCHIIITLASKMCQSATYRPFNQIIYLLHTAVIWI